MVEQLIRNQQVVGSNPTASSSIYAYFKGIDIASIPFLCGKLKKGSLSIVGVGIFSECLLIDFLTLYDNIYNYWLQ